MRFVPVLAVACLVLQDDRLYKRSTRIEGGRP